MALTTGSKLGLYEIVAPLGAGGMGEVYRARDAKLNRDVAIKVLPSEVARDRDRLARFKREAQLLASLNHPHIASIYGLEEAKGQPFLVLELVEGEDLSERLGQGPIPMEEALELARQIAEALEEAHEKGIVHRDLKPANIKLTPDGRVKVLDFGLAKVYESDVSGSTPFDLSQSPTLSRRATAAGVILGTAAYMSPEQARGKSVDKRADIWAFGVVLYEMVTGRQAFHGETVSDTLAAVLTREPDWAALPLDTSPSIRRLLRRCLERNPKNRVHDVADARIELDEAHAPDDSAPVAAVGGRRSNWWLGVGGALLAAFATWLAVRPSTPAPSPPWRFALGGLNVSIDVRQGLALSPDGRKLVYRGRGDDGVERLYVRSFDGFSREALPGTEQGGHPFFSPDGDWVGFFALGSLKKVALAGGSPQTLCSAGLGVGGTWLEDGTIVFVGDPEVGLQSLPASGGRPETILSLEPNEDISLITSPSALPAGNAVLCVVRKNERFDVAVFSLASRELHVIAEDGFSPMYVPTGHVLYQQGQGSSTEGSALLALPFDPERLEATGPAFPALTAVGTRISYQTTMFAVAPGGTLAYIPQTSLLGRGALVWIDRKGRETPVVEISKPLDAPRLSPDGKRVAFRTPAPNCDIWIHDLARGSTTRLTLEGDNHGVVWSPDGRRIAFGRAQGMDSELLTQATDGSGNVVRLAPAEGRAPIPSSFSPDGSSLLVRTHNKGTSNDIDLLATGNTPRFKPLITTPFDEGQAVFSPDGRLIAYVSNESGRYEVYVQTYPAVDGREQVSTDGGIEPVWSRDGKELFFRRGRELAAVDIRLSPTLSVGKPRVLFEGDFVEGPFMAGYDVSPDGRRFIMARGRSSAEGGEINVVLNWHQELLEKVPVK